MIQNVLLTSRHRSSVEWIQNFLLKSLNIWDYLKLQNIVEFELDEFINSKIRKTIEKSFRQEHILQ